MFYANLHGVRRPSATEEAVTLVPTAYWKSPTMWGPLGCFTCLRGPYGLLLNIVLKPLLDSMRINLLLGFLVILALLLVLLIAPLDVVIRVVARSTQVPSLCAQIRLPDIKSRPIRHTQLGLSRLH